MPGTACHPTPIKSQLVEGTVPGISRTQGSWRRRTCRQSWEARHSSASHQLTQLQPYCVPGTTVGCGDTEVSRVMLALPTHTELRVSEPVRNRHSARPRAQLSLGDHARRCKKAGSLFREGDIFKGGRGLGKMTFPELNCTVRAPGSDTQSQGHGPLGCGFCLRSSSLGASVPC